MKYFKTTLISIMAMFTMLFVPILVTDTVGATPKEEICKGVNNGSNCTASDGDQFGKFMKDIINILLFVIGAIAVLMIVIGGLRYVISGGDGSQTKAAKDTILYAVVGLIVSMMAYAIVNFVVLKVG